MAPGRKGTLGDGAADRAAFAVAWRRPNRMPLRKKHVRRAVASAVLIGLLVPLAALGAYALWARSGALDRALAAELELHLRCTAGVRGVHPTGPGDAAASSVDLAWATAEGTIRLHLADLKVRRLDSPLLWSITAGEGRLELESKNLEETLRAWNQRLVGPEDDTPPFRLTVPGFSIHVTSDLLTAVETGELEIKRGSVTPFRVSLNRSPGPAGSGIGRIRAGLHLDPGSSAGVFQKVSATVDGVPARYVSRFLVGPSGPAPAGGTADLRLVWARTGWNREVDLGESQRDISISINGMELAEWTEGLPGGPVRGTASLNIHLQEDRRDRPNLAVDMDAADGDIAAETLRWLAGLPGGLTAPGPVASARFPIGRLAVHFRQAAGQGRFEEAADGPGAIPLMICRSSGTDTPLLWASRQPFDAKAFWEVLRPALGSAPAKTPESK